MHQYPKITIITACYNHEKYIVQTIESVISQGYPNLEYIVINDGSSDDSGRVIDKYADRVSKVIHLDGHRPTVATALNKGFDMATGEIIGWINSDDLLMPRSLFVVAELFTQIKEMQWVTSQATTINHKSNIVRVFPFRKNKYDYLNGDWSVIQQESTFFRRELWERAGGKLDDSYIQAFDSELWSRFFLEAEHYHVNTALGAYRLLGQSRSIRAKGEFKEYTEKALKKMRDKASADDMRLARSLKRTRRYARHLLRVLPHKVYSRTRLGKKINYKVLDYDFHNDKWVASIYNPFRLI